MGLGWWLISLLYGRFRDFWFVESNGRGVEGCCLSLIYSIQTVNTCIEKNTFAQTSLCLEGTAPSRSGGPGHLYECVE